MRPQAPRVVRQRKLNKSVPQPVLREDQIESAEFDSLQNQQHVETGVERSEENEYHLQAALAANSARTEKDEEKEIPAPPAQESTDIKYDELYTLQFVRPNTYIRFSDTVEEACGCPYDMTTEDDVFLKGYNQKKSASNRCSEDDFEKIMDVFELTAQSQAPFASVDNHVVPFERMKPELLKTQIGPNGLPLKQNMVDKLLGFAKDIYEHWRERRRISGNNPIQPSLKREIHQENDDADPYVCFRRRDVRAPRKTRARDVQSTDKLKRLRKEIEDGRALVAMALQRERTKRDLLNIDKSIFEQRTKLKEAKIRLGIKGDDEDLINQKVKHLNPDLVTIADSEQPQKRKISDFAPSMQRPPPGQQLRMPPQVDGRMLNTELVQLRDLLAQRQRELDKEVEEKTMQHRVWNQNHIDVTREPLSPVHGQGSDTGFRPATAQYQYLMTPPSSVTSESFDHPSPGHESHEPLTVRYSSPPHEEESRSQPAYRRRIGRGGRLWIDRRGMSSAAKGAVDEVVFDRWKFDQDDDEEQPVYEVDPYDTKALRFRATIPFPPHLYPQHPRQDNRSRPPGASPLNNRTVAAPAVAVQQQQPPAPAPT
ncbi:hypothetical protein HYALB_00006343 [Hymenoscyphus albidus]|uniref:Enhancer of polycomb-like protein n=1 Tax=Hymenoscyphus albidus TaxID=595503 RepID=A0A9N9PSR1_9HELO|nr:hypothetical protein HYALB_00006343 [Hymenoscyphus albidus]